MATLPLAVGSVTNCEWEGMGTMLLRDNQGNGNLIWVSQYSNLDIRVSADNGATWTEPTSLGAAGQYGSTWAQDSAGNLHGVLPNGVSNAVYRKVTLTRTAGDITSAAETTTLTLACITGSALGRSWSIAVVSDGQASPVERVAIAWMDFAASRLSLRLVVTTEAAGVSPTLNTDFKAFDESTATGELIRNDTDATTGTSTGFCTKVCQMPGSAGSAKWRLYVAMRAYDTTNVSERLIAIYEAAWNDAASQPFWGAFALLGSGATPAETAIHNIDLLPDATNNRVVMACMDTTSTTPQATDIWVVNTNGTLDKNTTYPQITYSYTGSEEIVSTKLGTDQNGMLWSFSVTNATTMANIGVAYYSGSQWVVHYQAGYQTASPDDICAVRTSNAGNRMFYSIAFDGSNGSPVVMSVSLSAESKTVKTSGGDYGTVTTAVRHAPDLALYDHVLTIHWKSGGWNESVCVSDDYSNGYFAWRTIISGVLFEIRSDPSARHAGKWDTSKVYLTSSSVTLFIYSVLGSGTLRVVGLQLQTTGVAPGDYALSIINDPYVDGNSPELVCDSCIMTAPGDFVVHAEAGSDPYVTSIYLNNCVGYGATSVFNSVCYNTGTVILRNCSAYSSASTAKYAFRSALYGVGVLECYNCVGLVSNGTSNVAFYDDIGGGWGDSNYNVAAGSVTTPSFVAAGALAANAATTTLAVVAPSLAIDDIMICAILSKDNQVVSPPDGTWMTFVEVNNTANQRLTLAWKRAVAGSSGATFNFTKPIDNNILFCGVISAWRGCVATGSPIDATTPTTSANASSDTVTYATFDPTETTAFVVAIGVYNNDLTTAGSIAGTDPTFVNRFDLETATGSDGSIFGYSGASTGAATGARSHSTTSTADDINIGCLFGLVASLVPSTQTAPGANSLSSQTPAQIGFVDKANGDLHIGAGSVCIDAGIKQADFSVDFEGRPRLLGKWDVGAHELKPVWTKPTRSRQSTPLRM